MGNIIKENPIEDSSEETHLQLRGFLVEKITDPYNRSIKASKIENGNIIPSIEDKLNRCFYGDLIPFLHQDRNRQGITEVTITVDMLKELTGKKIENITTLEDLAKELGFK